MLTRQVLRKTCSVLQFLLSAAILVLHLAFNPSLALAGKIHAKTCYVADGRVKEA